MKKSIFLGLLFLISNNSATASNQFFDWSYGGDLLPFMDEVCTKVSSLPTAAIGAILAFGGYTCYYLHKKHNEASQNRYPALVDENLPASTGSFSTKPITTFSDSACQINDENLSNNIIQQSTNNEIDPSHTTLASMTHSIIPEMSPADETKTDQFASHIIKVRCLAEAIVEREIEISKYYNAIKLILTSAEYNLNLYDNKIFTQKEFNASLEQPFKKLELLLQNEKNVAKKSVCHKDLINGVKLLLEIFKTTESPYAISNHLPA